MPDQPLDIGYDPQLSQDFGPRVQGLLQRLPGFTVGEGYQEPAGAGCGLCQGEDRAGLDRHLRRPGRELSSIRHRG